MKQETPQEKREVGPIVGFRPLELAPLLNRWLHANPDLEITALLRRSLRQDPEIRKLAGKRWAHLLGGLSALFVLVFRMGF
jgi:hypothetical protein